MKRMSYKEAVHIISNEVDSMLRKPIYLEYDKARVEALCMAIYVLNEKIEEENADVLEAGES